MKPNDDNEVFIDDRVFTSTYDMLRFADSFALNKEEFAMWLKAKGYKPDAIIKLTAEYLASYESSKRSGNA